MSYTELHAVAVHEPSWLQRFGTLVFVRDWHPVLRDPLDLFRLSFPIGAVIFAFTGDWDAVVRLLLPGLAVFLVRAIEFYELRDNPRLPAGWLEGGFLAAQSRRARSENAHCWRVKVKRLDARVLEAGV
jgi:hypothetical protein